MAWKASKKKNFEEASTNAFLPGTAEPNPTWMFWGGFHLKTLLVCWEVHLTEMNATFWTKVFHHFKRFVDFLSF